MLSRRVNKLNCNVWRVHVPLWGGDITNRAKQIDTNSVWLIRINEVGTSNNTHNQSRASFNIDICSTGRIGMLMYGRDNFGCK
jgi:hypothetical protein